MRSLVRPSELKITYIENAFIPLVYILEQWINSFFYVNSSISFLASVTFSERLPGCLNYIFYP